MAAHLTKVPFENLSVHLQEDINSSNVDFLLNKIVNRNRGGFCYELNGAFAALLSGLGYEVEILAGCVMDSKAGVLGALFDHMVLRVTIDGIPWLVDTGFGRFSYAPISFAKTGEQTDRFGKFAVAPSGGAHDDVDVLHDGSLAYRVEQRPRARSDFVPHCWWHATNPKSHFTRNVICSRVTDAGRISLSGTKLILTPDVGECEERKLSESETLAVYSEEFGIHLDALPRPLH
jgi:N-hydroxyarylamine O-acetyltransferase